MIYQQGSTAILEFSPPGYSTQVQFLGFDIISGHCVLVMKPEVQNILMTIPLLDMNNQKMVPDVAFFLFIV